MSPRGLARLAAACLVSCLTFFTPAASAQLAPPPNVPVTDTALRAYQGPWLVANPADPEDLAVSFQDGNSFPTCWLGLSSDGGESWEQVPLVGQDGEEDLPEGFYICFRPTLAAAPDGSMYYAYVAGQAGVPGPNAIYLIASTDGGETFEDPVPIDNAPLPPGNAGDGVPRMAVDRTSGRLYVAWQQVKGPSPNKQDVLVASSGDGGQTFSAPVTLNPATQNAASPNLDVGPDGRVYVTYTASARPTADPAQPLLVQVATSGDQGRTFGPPVTAQEEYNCAQTGPDTCASAAELRFEGRNANGPQIVAGRVPGVAHLVSYGLESGLGNDLFRARFSSTRDSGAGWSRARTIGIPSGLEDHHQITPTISRAPNGRLDVVLYDLAPSLLENTYLLSSDDDGKSFRAPRLLSEVPSDTNIRPAFGFGQGPVAGSRLVASTNESTYAAWTDSRRGEGDSAKLDIFSARVSLVADSPEDPEPFAEESPASIFAGCPALTANVIQGTAAANSIVGTLRADRVFAGAGNDYVEGLEGDDCIDLGSGADRGQGGHGADLMLGRRGEDRLLGAGGNDRLRGGSGDDRLSGGRGRDGMIGGGGSDVILGGGSADRLAGGAGRDRIGGDSGDDEIRGSSGEDLLTGGSGRDRLSGGSGDDRLSGGSGDDRLSGGSGDDRLSGGSGDDRLLARDHRRDRISCGPGRDTVVADRLDVVARGCERVRRPA